MQIDHIEPFKQGGKCEFGNLIASCRSCNHRKHTLSIEDFRTEIEKSLIRLERDYPTFRMARRFGLVVVNPEPVKFYFETLEELL